MREGMKYYTVLRRSNEEWGYFGLLMSGHE